jgi:cell division protein FtsA
MARSFSVGIDIGTAHTRCVVLSNSTNGEPEVLAAVSVPTRGMRHGYIVNLPEITQTLQQVKQLTEREAGISIRKAVFSIGGVSLLAEVTQGGAIIAKADGEIMPFDVKTALSSAEEAINTKNRDIIHRTIIGWKLDGKEIPGKPEGMNGIKLEVRVLYVTCLSQHLADILAAAAEAGIEVIDIIPSSIAGSAVTLSDRQKAVGVLLVNIGAETVSVSVFENSTLIGLSVLPIGSTDITNDIALGFRIPLEEAEGIKTGTITSTAYPRRKVDEIIEARLSDIFELIDGYLKKIKRSGLLPAGIVLSGGGSGNSLVESLAKEMLRLPARLAVGEYIPQSHPTARDASWFVAYGLARLAQTGNIEGRAREGTGARAKGFIKEFLRQFLP